MSIGAEPDGNRWRLSDGPPPGWAWNVGALVTSLKSSPVDNLCQVIATVPNEEDSPAARDAALMACRRAGLFAMVEQAPTAKHPLGPDLTGEIEFTPDEDPSYVVKVRARSDSGAKSVLLSVSDDEDDKARVYITADDAERIAGAARRILRRPDAPTAPDLGAKVDAIHDAAGAPPTGAAAMLYRLFCYHAGEDEHGPIISDPMTGNIGRAETRRRLCEAFVAELRASLPASPMPAPRTTDGALTAYLLEHYREAWRPGEDALALAIRLLGAAKTAAGLADGTAALHASRMREVEAERDEARKEAEAADENAKELAAELTRLRAALARETERRIEAERGRGEALGDLATVRNDVLKTAADLAAKMGAPHG